MLTIYFTKLKPGAKIPSKREEDAGYDVYACFDEESIAINPGEIKLIPVGLASAFSSDYYIQVQERSSTGSRGMSTRCGVIDSGYRGEHMIVMNNTGSKPIIIAKQPVRFNQDQFTVHDYNKAIAQYIVLPVPKSEAKELSLAEFQNLEFESERGDGGFGASGK